MISVSRVKLRVWFSLGLRAPPRRFLPLSPLVCAMASGVTSRATAIAEAKSHGPLPWPRMRLLNRDMLLPDLLMGGSGGLLAPTPPPPPRLRSALQSALRSALEREDRPAVRDAAQLLRPEVGEAQSAAHDRPVRRARGP